MSKTFNEKLKEVVTSGIFPVIEEDSKKRAAIVIAIDGSNVNDSVEDNGITCVHGSRILLARAFYQVLKQDVQCGDVLKVAFLTYLAEKDKDTAMLVSRLVGVISK